MIKRIFMTCIFVLICVSIASAAPFVVCDPTTDPVVSSIVEIDGVEMQGTYEVVDGIYAKLLDLGAVNPPLSGGSHTIRARFMDTSGWLGGWSAPLSANKPGLPGNVRIQAE